MEAGYSDGSVINIANGFEPDLLADLLVGGNYVSDKDDAQYIAKHLSEKLTKESLPNLGALNLRRFRMPADSAFKYGGTGLQERVSTSRKVLGISDEVNNQYANNLIKDVHNESSGTCIIKVNVQQPIKSVSLFQKYISRRQTEPVTEPVLVQLLEHYYDSAKVALLDTTGYAITNKDGIVMFHGLKEDGYYSVLPIKEGFEYGSPKGTTQGTLGNMKEEKRTFTFVQREHQITPFDGLTYRLLKEDGVLTARTPIQFRDSFIPYLIFFFLTWWALHFFFCIRKKDVDQLLVPILMTLSGICILTMYSITNPLMDKMLGNEMAKGAITGIILIAIISEINFVKFFNSHYKWFGWVKSFHMFKNNRFSDIPFDIVFYFLNWIIKPFPQKVRESKIKGSMNFFNVMFYYLKFLFCLLCLPFELLLRGIYYLYKLLPKKLQLIQLTEGSGYLLVALLLSVLLFPFGTGPEGSGVKVNLFFFQPSEIAKYLIVIFLSAYFVLNKRAEKIQAFSERLTLKSFLLQGKTVLGVIVGLVLLLGVYLALGDMGPALVLTVSFIIMYSVARRDFPYLILGVATFVVMIVIGNKMGNSSQIITAVFAFLWLVGWIAYGFIKPRKQLYESAIFMSLVISVFMYGGSILTYLGFPHQGQRLQDRNEIYANVWNNEVTGGDQVVQGLWGLSSGGLTGQGLGEGSPNLVPAFHTDMIFTSMGEILGWTGLLLIVLCMAILLHRSLLIGRRAGHPFAFYLAAGIAVITGVQFLVITLGSLGLIPLTGVAVPFLSYGKTSLIINLAAFAVVLSISNLKAQEHQQTYKETYKWMVAYSSASYALVSVVILAFLLWYQHIEQDKTLIRPALVSNRQGERLVEYNPRINLLIKKMYAGNIYDTNGLLLATNEKELIQKGSIIDAGIDNDNIENELKQRKRRYYPFGQHLFFMTGDFNTTILWNDSDSDPRGYIAERRHLASLRGFDNLKKEDDSIKKIQLTASKYRNSSFLNSTSKDYSYTDYDYSELLPMLKDGLNGSKLSKWNENREERDIKLTVDAKLQTRMQNEITEYVKANFSGLHKLRVSAVVLNAKTGDLLCSANYPLPDQDRLRNMPLSGYSDNIYSENDRREKAYTDRDLGLTFQTAPGSTAKVMSALAGLQKLGTEMATSKYHYYIDGRETIEPPTVEPNFQKDGHNTTLEEAIVKSSNCYFINLVNDQKLYPQLYSIYSSVGIRVDDEDAIRAKDRSLTPYYFTYEPPMVKYKTEIESIGNNAVRIYEDYINKRKKNGVYEQMSGYNNGHDWNMCAWAWGQGSLRATPLNMARIASIVVNDGKMVTTQFIHKDSKSVKRQEQQEIPIVSDAGANILKEYMITESMVEQKRRNGVSFTTSVGGKTGTPEREIRYRITNKAGKINSWSEKPNDGWYIFFTDSEEPLAVAVRMERLVDKGSKTAVRLSDKVVIKVLKELGYVN